MNTVQPLLETLVKICPNSSLHLDNVFIQALQEEVDTYWFATTKDNVFLIFEMMDTGEVVFKDLAESAPAETNLVALELISPRKLDELRLEKDRKLEESAQAKLEKISQIELDRKKHELYDYLLRQKNENI